MITVAILWDTSGFTGNEPPDHMGQGDIALVFPTLDVADAEGGPMRDAPNPTGPLAFIHITTAGDGTILNAIRTRERFHAPIMDAEDRLIRRREAFVDPNQIGNFYTNQLNKKREAKVPLLIFLSWLRRRTVVDPQNRLLDVIGGSFTTADLQ